MLLGMHGRAFAEVHCPFVGVGAMQLGASSTPTDAAPRAADDISTKGTTDAAGPAAVEAAAAAVASVASNATSLESFAEMRAAAASLLLQNYRITELQKIW